MPVKKKHEINFRFEHGSGIDNLDFEGCCGAQIIYNLPLPDEDTYGDRLDRQLPGYRTAVRAWVKEEVSKELPHKSLTLIILNEHQEEYFGSVLTGLGFKVSGPVLNYSSGNYLYTYLYEKKTKKVRKK